ncbi:hypothetical protein GCM10022280_21420 [Sphingomonas swuensis]|uniref:Uncharacterized protein n=1 Tax=Sphingomonas swuensis TaxID=977800 RepID=A0ABP7T3V5_9SPHN
MNMRQTWATFAGLSVGVFAVPAAAVPPPPPAQAGSEVGTHQCGRQSLTLVKSWDYKVGRKKDYAVRIGGKPLSQADAQRLNSEIELRGPFQAASVYCVDGVPYELALHRYSPTSDRLGIYFRGRAISSIR